MSPWWGSCCALVPDLYLFIIFLVMFIFNLSFDVFSISNRALFIWLVVKRSISAAPSIILLASCVVAPKLIFSVNSGPASGVDSARWKRSLFHQSIIFSIKIGLVMVWYPRLSPVLGTGTSMVVNSLPLCFCFGSSEGSSGKILLANFCIVEYVNCLCRIQIRVAGYKCLFLVLQ